MENRCTYDASWHHILGELSLDSLHISAKEEPISPSSVVKSLGVKFNSFLNFEHHINAIVQECNMHLRNLWVIGSKLSFELKRQLIHCLIFSRLDYCNGVLYGLPDVALKKLQKIQNSCARFLFGPGVIRKWDSVTPPVALFWKVAGSLILTSKIGYFWSHGAHIVAYTIIVKISVRGMGLGM